MPLLLNILPEDGLPPYAETNPQHLIAEPYNMVSAAIFIVIVLYWVFKLKGRFSSFPFLTFATFVLAVGAIGGTIYHGFRYHPFFMYLDWLPILVIALSTSFWFLYRLTKSILTAALWLAGTVLIQWLSFFVISEDIAINISYGMLALVILIPLIVLMRKTSYVYWPYVVIAFTVFAAALFFRIADNWELLSMGTHFLWHLFGALACHLMFKYLYLLNKRYPTLKLSGITFKRYLKKRPKGLFS